MSKSVDISELNLNDTYFHFTSTNNMRSVLTEGLKARVGDASKMVGDEDAKGKQNHDIEVGKISLITSRKEYIKQRESEKEKNMKKGLINTLIKKLQKSLEGEKFGYVDLATLSPEQREKAFIEFGEGDDQLTRLLKVAYEHNVESMFCCSGHGRKSGYVVFKVNDENLQYLQDVGKVLSNQGIVTNFEEHYRLGKRVSFNAIGSQPLHWFGIAADVMENVKNFDSTNPSLYYHEEMFQSAIPLDFRIKKGLLDLLRKFEPTLKALPEPKKNSAREKRKQFADILYVKTTNEKSENTLEGDIPPSHTKGEDGR